MREALKIGILRLALRRARRGADLDTREAIDKALDDRDVVSVLAEYAYDEFSSSAGIGDGSILEFIKWLIESGNLEKIIKLLLSLIAV